MLALATAAAVAVEARGGAAGAAREGRAKGKSSFVLNHRLVLKEGRKL
jgi:hypothetical protein